LILRGKKLWTKRDDRRIQRTVGKSGLQSTNVVWVVRIADSPPSMSQDHHVNKNSSAESKTEREILELRVDSKLTEAKEALHNFNKEELQRIAGNIHEPKLKRLRNWSGFIITVLVIGNIAGWYSVTERVHSEADRVINQKLVDPQLTSTLDEALSKKAIPLIVAQVRPIETNVVALKSNVNEQTAIFGAMALDISNKQAQLTSEQVAIRKNSFILCPIKLFRCNHRLMLLKNKRRNCRMNKS
jgi:hypothetical protein